MMRALRLTLPSLLLSIVALGATTLGCGETSGTDGGGGSRDDTDAGEPGTGGGATEEREVIGPVTLVPPPPVPEQDAGEQLGALCTTFEPCACPGYELATVESCEDEFSGRADAARAEGEAAGLTYDPECVGRVVAGFETLGCSTASEALTSFELLRGVGYIAGCKMFYGQGAEGDDCTRLVESNGDSCGAELRCVDGTCAPGELTLAEGVECESNEQCEPGLLCLPQPAGDACTAVPTVGEACLYGLFCDLDAACVDGACAALPALGEPCAEVAAVTGATCAPGAICGDSGECVSLPGPGESCVPTLEYGLGSCALGSRCEGGSCVVEEPAICAGGSFPLFP
jgi:hypothetical protein